MNEPDGADRLAGRLHELGQRAPVPVADPLSDIRRGRTALRRRNARYAAGTGLVAVCAGAVGIGSIGWPGGSTDAILDPAGSPSAGGSPTSTPASTPAAGAGQQCVVGVTTDPSRLSTTRKGIVVSPSTLIDAQRQLERAPEVTAALGVYRNAASAILDPSGTHLDPADGERSDNIQSGFGCDPKTGEYLTSLGTEIGWTSGGALGVVRIEVVSPHQDQQPQVVLEHDGWHRDTGHLPADVVTARIVSYSEDGGGHAVVVERADGLTVAVDASGVWGNNAPLGSPSATGLPAVADLLTLAASSQLTLPTLASR